MYHNIGNKGVKVIVIFVIFKDKSGLVLIDLKVKRRLLNRTANIDMAWVRKRREQRAKQRSGHIE